MRGKFLAAVLTALLAGIGICRAQHGTALQPPGTTAASIPPLPAPLAIWPWPQALKETPYPGVTHWLVKASPDVTALDLLDFDFSKTRIYRWNFTIRTKTTPTQAVTPWTTGRRGLDRPCST